MSQQNNNTQTLKEQFQNINIKLFFGLIILLYVLISIILNWYIVTDELYYQFLGEQFSKDLINKIVSFKSKWDWVGFVISPIFLFAKILLVAGCLEVGNFIFDLKLQFKQLLRIVILAETVFLLVALVRIIWFFIFSNDLTMEYIQSFYPLSLLNLVVIENVPQYLIYPLQLVNVFELIYWIVLAFLIRVYTHLSFDKSFGFIVKAYGLGLLAWVVLVVFLSIN